MIIPKEMQALERLKSTLLAEGYWQDVLEDFSIIENALNKYYRLLKEDNLTTKKIKALEIIKKLFDKCDFELISSYEDGKPIYILRLGTKQRKWVASLVLAKEEYDLLKEVLL